jgi:hypothetical protein
MLCVLETRLHKSRVEGLARRLGYDRVFAISISGCSGGLAMFWNDEIKIDILSYSQYHLYAIITERIVILGGWRVSMGRLRYRRGIKIGICSSS